MMHYWGDEWFQQNGEDLNKAISEINKGMREIHVLCLGKEKYGCLRTDFFYMWDGSWYHWHNNYAKDAIYNNKICKIATCNFRYKLDNLFAMFNRLFGIVKLVNKWQIKEINKLFQTTCKKYPHLVDELISDTDCYMYMKPGKYGDIDGEKIHNKYWKTIDKLD